MPRSNDERVPVLAGGVRTPFLRTAGAYGDLMSYELAAKAIGGLVERTSIDPRVLGMVVMGTVVHETNTTNVAREAMLAAGVPSTVPAYTVAMAGISPNVGVANLCDAISLGRISMGIAGGTENFSDVPVRLSQNVRRSLMKIRQRRSTRARLEVISKLRLRDLGVDVPSSADFTTRLTMGAACEAMAHRYPTTREASDAFAARSHRRAIEAQRRGVYAEQCIPVEVAGHRVEADDSPRADADEASLARLRPAFARNGIITAGNASGFTDGAGALLLTSRAEAKRRGLPVRAVVVDYVFGGVESLETEMLLGPAMTIPRLLARNGLGFGDVGVFELHEAFASQVLINRACMASREFVTRHFGEDAPCGEIPMDRLNAWGGSLALGNPFAATGVRLFLTAAQRMAAEGARHAVIATCAGGGLGAAFLLAAPDSDG